MRINQPFIFLALLGGVFVPLLTVSAATSPEPVPAINSLLLTQDSSRNTLSSKQLFTIPLTQFGYGKSFRLSGNNAETTIVADVYQGFVPKAITIAAKGTPNIQNGFITLEHEGKLLATLQLPTKEEVWRIPLPADKLTIKDDQFIFSFRAIMNTDDEQCSAFKTRWLDLSDGELQFEGAPKPPRTVAEFFPHSLKKIELFVGKNPAPETVAAALDLVAFAESNSSGRVIETRLIPDVPTSENTTSRYDERQVVLRVGTQPRLAFATSTSAWPVLMIDSPTSTWKSTIGALTNIDTSALLVASDVRSQTAETAIDQNKIEAVTFKDLGKAFLSLKGVGEMEATISFSQSNFGRQVKDVKIHLMGMTSALQKSGVGRLDVYVNDKFLDTYQLPEEGESFERTIKIPNSILIRDNTVRFVGYYTPPGGNCRVGLNSIAIDISNQSYFEAVPAEVSFPDFDLFPQTFLKGVDVLIDTSDETTLSAASDLVALLQRISPRFLRIGTVYTKLPAVVKRPLIIVSSRPDTLGNLKAFIQPKTLIVSDAERTTNLGINGSFSSLQTFFERGQPILALTHHDWPAGLRSLPNYLRSKEGWYTTRGNVMVLSAAGQASFTKLDPTEQVGKGEGKKLQPGLNVLRDTQYSWTVFAGFGAFIVVVASLGFTYRQRRAKKRLEQLQSPRGFTK